jgi:hypothetical protein
MFIQRDVTIADALEEIRSGRYAEEIGKVRTLVAKHGRDSAEVKAAKLELPAYLFSGKISGKVAQAMNEGRFHHSGLLQLDFDGIQDPEAMREELIQDRHVLAAWLSPSGQGVKGLLAIAPATTEDAHRAAFITAEIYFAKRGLTLDKACKNSNRLCFAGWDYDLRIREHEPAIFTAKGTPGLHPLTPLSELSEESVHTAESASSMSSSYSKSSVSSISSISQPHQGNIGERIRASEQARRKLESDTRVYGLYKKYVERRFSPAQGKRNSNLIEMVTFLFRAVGTQNLMTLVAAFYDLNQEIFSDPREQHMAEAAAHLKTCKESWLQDLSPEQRKDVLDLPEHYQEAFRICRDLAMLKDERQQPCQFFLSYNDLSHRIGKSQKDAERILRTFDSQGWLKILIKGTQHKPGSKGKSTLYLWTPSVAVTILILSLPLIFYGCPIHLAPFPVGIV